MVEQATVNRLVTGSSPVPGAEYLFLMFYLYILYSHKTKKLYTGQTNNIERRLKEHFSGKIFSTKNNLPVSLIYTEECQTRSEVMKREKFFKSLHSSNLKQRILKKFLTDGSSKS